MKISVIIPIFNAAQFLPRCLESVLSQTLHEIEVICVDDCSTDGSRALLEATGDPRIKLISFPENRGVAAARNAGAAAASAEYVFFLDSDDWLDPDYLEAMLARSQEWNADIVVNSHYIEEFPDSGKRAVSGGFGFLSDMPGSYPTIQVLNRFPPTVWTRLYRRSFLTANRIAFPAVYNGTEDIYFTGLAGMLQPEQPVFRGPAYHYLQRPGSLLRQHGIAYYNILSFKALYEEFQRRGIPTEGLRLFYAGPVILDSAEKFGAIRPFFRQICDEVHRHPELYAPADLFLMDAVLNSPDYPAFLSAFNPNIALSFIRSRMKS